MPTQTRKKGRKPAEELTTAEVFRRLFPKEVRDEVKREATEKAGKSGKREKDSAIEEQDKD